MQSGRRKQQGEARVWSHWEGAVELQMRLCGRRRWCVALGAGGQGQSAGVGVEPGLGGRPRGWGMWDVGQGSLVGAAVVAWDLAVACAYRPILSGSSDWRPCLQVTTPLVRLS